MSLPSSDFQATWTLPSRWSEHCECWTALCWCCALWEEFSVRPWRWTGRWSATTCPFSHSSTNWTAWAPTPTEPCSKWGTVHLKHTHIVRQLKCKHLNQCLFLTFFSFPSPTSPLCEELHWIGLPFHPVFIHHTLIHPEQNWTIMQHLWTSPWAWRGTCAASLT